MFLYLFPIMFVVAFFFYLEQRPHLKKSFLTEGEEVQYIQKKTTITQIDFDKNPQQTAWICIKITQKRIFFLYPDTRAIFKILDFSRDKQIVYNKKLLQYVFYLEKAAMKIEENKMGQNIFYAKTVDRNGSSVEFRFVVTQRMKLKEVLKI